jgi:hypothetical protein
LSIVVDAGGVDEADVVLGEADRRQRLELDAVFLRVLADRRMHGARRSGGRSRLDAAGGEQLAHVFERIDGVLHGLGREAVHQVGVHQDAGVGEGAGDAGDLLDRHALLHQLEQAVGGHFQPAGDGDAAAVGELLAQLGGEGFLEADVAPPRNRHGCAAAVPRPAPQRLGRRGFVDEVEAGLAGLGDDGLDAVDQQCSAAAPS